MKTKKKSKFGELIDSNVPVLLVFYTTTSELVNNTYNFFTVVPRNIAAYFGDEIKIVKIDVEKNKELAMALKIQKNPTMLLYICGEERYRYEHIGTAKDLINILTPYIVKT